MSYQNIKCPNCGVYNVNRDYCSKCNTILSYKKRREQEFKKEEEARLEQRRLEKKNNPSFFEKYGNLAIAMPPPLPEARMEGVTMFVTSLCLRSGWGCGQHPFHFIFRD